MNKEHRQSDPPLLNGFSALEHASQHPGIPLLRYSPLALRPQTITLDTAYWLADRQKVDQVFVYAVPDS